MKSILAILTILTAIGCKQKATNQNKTEKEEQAKIEILQDFHNFGNLQAGETVAYSFKLENPGSAPLIIEKIETDCGCIQVEYPEDAVLPGESDFIEVIFNSAGETGRIYKGITVFSNTKQKEIKLAIAATVKNEIINLYN